MKPAASFAFRSIGTLAFAIVFWIGLGYLAIGPLGAIYGWSGHPSMPRAPLEVYVCLYLVVLPALCLFLAWKLVWRWGARGFEKGSGR